MHLLLLFGDEENLSVVAEPSSIDLYVLDLTQPVDPCSAQTADNRVCTGPVRLNERARVKLSRTLVNPRNYEFGMVLGDVTSRRIRVRATRQREHVLVDLDLRYGGMAIVRDNGKYTAGSHFVPICRHARRAILEVAKDAFPDDRDIQALE